MHAAQLELSPGCVILCTPGDKSMETPETITGVSYSVGGVVSYVGVLSCVIYGIIHT